MSKSPLASLVLVAYKQERYVGEAVRSALAQDYDNLEVVLSDDCSPDGTFDIMKREVDSYRGPHRVILRRNEANGGVVAHLNQAWAASSGEFIVSQAGDDVSLPGRVSRLVEMWRKPSPVDMVCSGYVIVDSNSRPIEGMSRRPIVPARTLDEAVTSGVCFAEGCALGYDRRLYSDFGGLDPKLREEDWVLAFRALLGRGIRVIDDRLLLYRMHDSNLALGTGHRYAQASRNTRRAMAANRQRTVREWLRAWDLSGRGRDEQRRQLASWEKYWTFEVAGYDSPRLLSPAVSMSALRAGLSIRIAAGLLKRHFFRV